MISLKWFKELGALLCFLGALLGILFSVFAPVVSYAGNPPDVPADLTRLTLEELMDIQVTSVSKGAEDFSKAPSAIFVITQEDLRRSGVNTIPEALRMVPGVQVAQIDSSTWSITARGFNSRFANKLLVLIDGRSVYTHVFAGVFWDEQDLAVESAYAAAVEYEVKAAFIHNFTQFIDWPPEAFEKEDSPLQIGILGTGPIDKPLMDLNGKKNQKRFLEISRVNNLDNASEYHIIFINPSEKGQIRSILHALKGAGILTIGDTPDFAKECGIINFYLKSGKVRFEINLEASHRENLKISSKLLRLARIVSSQCD